jgi:hypothetical protein
LRAEALRFVIAEGVVHDVVRRASETYLTFGPHRGTDFAAVILDRDRRAVEAAGWRAEDLVGRRLRLRGWVELRKGPVIRLNHGRQVEVLDGPEPKLPPTAKRRRPASEAPDVLKQ